MNLKESMLMLTRLGIGHSHSTPYEPIKWEETLALASQQGLLAVVVDGLEIVPNKLLPQKSILLKLIGEVLQGYESRYVEYRRALSDLAHFYNEHGFRMMLLKGYACGLYWPKPNHRPYGDIDIWQFGDQKKSDEVLKREKRIKIDNGHHHHTVFIWHGFTVENHYDFINIHNHKSNLELERIFKELGSDDTHCIDCLGEKVYVPSPNLHSLFLLRHSMTDFAASRLTLRQLLDWGFFVEANKDKIDWLWLEGILEKYGMMDLYIIFNAICVIDLGFCANLFQSIQFDPFLKDKVLQDILSTDSPVHLPKGLFKRIVFKYQRWKANEWKRKLCFTESQWSSFWGGVWSHLLKPSSI